MDELKRLAALIKRRNAIEVEITAIIGRPANIGHLGEHIASKVFHIALEESASQKGIDGFFRDGMLVGKSVNIKWYAKNEAVLDITPDSPPDFYLVLTGPKSPATSSRGKTRPWLIESVYLFDAASLLNQLRARGVKIGIATSTTQTLWDKAQIYPAQNNGQLALSEEQCAYLALFT